MARVLQESFKVAAHSLHDRPPIHFQPLNSKQRAEFLHRCPYTRDYASAILNGKTRLLVSSTSWTPDEDFSLLVEALMEYNTTQLLHPTTVPNIHAVITGKGPLRSRYELVIEELVNTGRFRCTTVSTAWLSLSDYAMLLGAADLGVSLHTSSSGVDLPMKVVDMFGTGLPVVGWSEFEAWTELVMEGVNGRGFRDSGQLAGILLELLSGNGEELAKLRKGAMAECNRRWDDEWDRVAGRVLGLTKN